MQKKFLLGLLVIVGLFAITGCGSTKESTSAKKVSDEFSINDVTFKFDKDATFKDFSYKNAEGLEPDESQMANYLTYENKDIYDGRFVFRIAMMYYENKSLKDIEKQYENKDYKTKKINGIKWITYNTKSDKIDAAVYLTEKNNNLYGIHIMKYEDVNFDINELADVFMNGVSLN